MIGRLLPVCLLSCYALSAGANEANHQPYTIGDRAAGMGGGISAIAQATDACYYNPAGLGRATESRLSFSGVLYGYQEVKADDVYYFGEDADARTLAVIPSTLSIIRKVSDGSAVAFSVFEPTTRSYRYVESFPDTEHFYNLSRDDQSLWIGLSYGQELSEKLLWGVSIFSVYRTYTAAENLYWGNLNLSYSQATDYNSGELVAIAGVQVALSDRWSAGLALQAPSIHLFGEGSFFDYTVLAISGYEDAGSSQAENLDVQNRIPERVRAGIAWEKPGQAAWGLDVTWYAGVGYDTMEGYFADGTPTKTHVGLESTVDVNTGFEWVIAKQYPVRAGAFTSHSAAPPTTIGNSADPEHIDLYGLTCSVGQRTERTSLDIGLMYTFGKGKTVAWELTPEGGIGDILTDMRESHLYLTLNSVYRF